MISEEKNWVSESPVLVDKMIGVPESTPLVPTLLTDVFEHIYETSQSFLVDYFQDFPQSKMERSTVCLYSASIKYVQLSIFLLT